MATTHKITKVKFKDTPSQPQFFTVSLKIKEEDDSTYRLISPNIHVLTDGTVVNPVVFEGLQEDALYVARFVNNGQTDLIFHYEFGTGKPYELADSSPIRDKIIYQGQMLDIFEHGLLSSSLPPSHGGFLFGFSSNYRDSYGGFSNGIPTGVIKLTPKYDSVADITKSGVAINDTDSYMLMNNITNNPEARVTMGNLTGTSTRINYTLFLDFFLESDIDDEPIYLLWTGDDQNAMYIEITKSSSTDADVALVHRVEGTEHRTTLGPVPTEAWVQLEARYNHQNPSQNFVMAYFWNQASSSGDASNLSDQPEGDVNEGVYLGGKKISEEEVKGSPGITFRRFYFAPEFIEDNNSLNRLRDEYGYLPNVVFRDIDTEQEHVIPHSLHMKLDDNQFSVVVPDGVAGVTTPIPPGFYKMFVRTSTGTTTEKEVEVRQAYQDLDLEGFDIDFENDFDNAIAQFANTFYGFHSQWGGANGGVNANAIYYHRLKKSLCFDAHGDLYAGNLPGVSKPPKDETNKGWGETAMHNIPGDPKYGNIKIDRVGSVAVTKKYCGYGEYTVRMKVPKNIYGVSPAIWLFHYQELYPSDPRWDYWISRGGKPYGGSDSYMVINQEIDMELPSHLAQGIFATWDEQSLAYFDPLSLDTMTHIGIGNEEPDASKRGLFRLINPDAPNLLSSWEKVSDTFQVTHTPSFDHVKFNNWIGEKSSGSGWAYEEDSYYEAEEYLALLTDMGYNYADGEFHDWTIKWYKDRTELWVDGVYYRSNKAFVPTVAGRLTFGPWFPSASNPDGPTPWLPEIKRAWAGYPADFESLQIEVRRFTFIPFNEQEAGGVNETFGESFPDSGIVEFIPPNKI